MTRIQPLPEAQIDQDLKLTFFKHFADSNIPMTNMKATLAHSHLAFEVYMKWYTLYESVQKILGARMANLFAYTIADASRSVLCSMIFRKLIIDGGEEPEHPNLNSEEKLVVDFGRAIARYHGNIPDQLYRWVSVFYSDEEMVLLTAFAGQMIATSVFNNVVQVELDETLLPYLPFTIAF